MNSLSYEQYKILHSEIVMYCQIIEGDLKWIYSFMHTGNVDETRESLNKHTLGQIVRKLKELDNSDGNPSISSSDYNFLSQMTEKRNYWCHQCYRDFLYTDNWIYSQDYARICSKLERDHDKLKNVFETVEKLKIKMKR